MQNEISFLSDRHQGKMPLLALLGVYRHEEAHVLLSPLLDGAMSSASVPACFCLCFMAGSGAPRPGQP